MIDFNLINSPLEGTNLIEASAGTGKTYAIAGLFVRMIVEKAIPVREILVVTYTIAATEELRDRIRKNLREAAEAFFRGRSSDQFLHALLKKYPRETDRRLARERLRGALYDFDEAAIFTIHGFCRRILLENVFESGSLFDTELITDQEKLKEEIVEDFWRTHFYEAVPELVAYALSEGYGPKRFLELVRRTTVNPDVRIIPEVQVPSPDIVRNALSALHSEVGKIKKIWSSVREEVREKLKDPALNIRSYGTGTEELLNAMDNFLVSNVTFFLLFKGFEKLTVEKLAASTKKSHFPPEHPIFHICQSVKEKAAFVKALLEQHLLFLKGELIRTLRRELPIRKLKKNVLFFDDLLLRVRMALEGRGGEALAKAVRANYHAALIDEFQDTDPIQFTIFHAIFSSESNILFFIGDPKQAIYSFRSADLFTYMNAASHTDRTYTLGENWRSEPHLIKAVNTIFSRVDNPFIYDGISFSATRPAKDRNYEYLTINGQREAPFHLWFLSSCALAEGTDVKGEVAQGGFPEKLISKEGARELIVRAVAGEISRLLYLGSKRQALIGQKPLQEKDIAVLVRTNREAGLIQEGLSALNIPSVLYSTGSIFATHEARELERILISIAAPGREELIRAALATDMMGVNGEEIDRLLSDESTWGKWLLKFRGYHDVWHKYGFIVMFRAFMTNEKVRTRLISLPRGQWRLATLLHLAEVLHRESIEQRSSMTGLIKWLSEQRNPEMQLSDKYQLRLESDEDAVRVITIHKSKGLEYPVVFCPFMWGGSRLTGNDFSFHDRENEWQLTYDLGSSNSASCKKLAERELLAENIRLFYVALTRAKNRCYLIWGRFNKAGTSAPAYLFHRTDEEMSGREVEVTEARFKSLSGKDFCRELEGLSDRAEGAIKVEPMPLEMGVSYLPRQNEQEVLTSREFSGKIDRSFRIASFSSLVSGQSESAELPDRDTPYSTATNPPDILDEGSDILAFPRGAKAGTFLHDILEHTDFTEENKIMMKDLVDKKLQEYGFEAKWEETVTGMMQKIISFPLPLEHPEGKGLTLSAISNRERLNELEFYFPLQPISPERLREIFAPYSDFMRTEERQNDSYPFWHERLHFSPVRGFMKGFIDMVFRVESRFYLIDWKSNFLGYRVKDYNRKALLETMTDSFYFLQYHLYTVALHKYLSTRLPDYSYDTHFGGVYYCFLRGMDPAWGPDYGVYRDRPSSELIADLTRNLIAGG
ncbi:MAG: exodeoxyribonuclease V subunit beta [Syntrophales bacterium]